MNSSYSWNDHHGFFSENIPNCDIDSRQIYDLD